MKQLIMNVLEDMSGGQINLESKAARKSVANTIVAAIKTNKKGWFLDIGTVDGKPKLTKEELEIQRAKETWVCTICGKSTYEVDYDYIGTKTNHLGCELEMENADEDARTHQGLKRAKELSQEAIEDGMRLTKNDMQLEHENKVFGKDEEEDAPINTYFTADVKDERDLEDQKFGGDTGTDADFNIPPGEEVDGMYFDDEVKGWEEAVGYEEEVKKTDTLIDKSVEDFERNKLSEEIVDDKDAEYIYESPDGGETIYRREFGSDERVKIKIEEMEK
jgi:hypothetical protein